MDADINHAIAERLEQHRIRLGMSLAELARASGVRAATLERVERQGIGCSAADLWRLALVLDVSISELCGTPAAVSGPPTPASRAFNDNRFPAPAAGSAEQDRIAAHGDGSPGSVQ